VNASIDTAHIAASQITNALMADNAVDSAELAAGSVDIAHLSASGSAGVAKVLASVAGDGASYLSSYNLDAITQGSTGVRTHTFTIDFAANTFQFFGSIRQASLSIQRYYSHAVGSVIELVETSTGTDSDFPTSISGFGAQV